MAIMKWETIAVTACTVTCLMVKSWLPGLWKETKNVELIPRGCRFWGRVSRWAATPMNPAGCSDSGWILRAQLRDTSLGSRQKSSLKILRAYSWIQISPAEPDPEASLWWLQAFNLAAHRTEPSTNQTFVLNTHIPGNYWPWRRLSPLPWHLLWSNQGHAFCLMQRPASSLGMQSSLIGYIRNWALVSASPGDHSSPQCLNILGLSQQQCTVMMFSFGYKETWD